MRTALNSVVKKATGWLVRHNFREKEVDLIRNKFEQKVDAELNAIIEHVPVALGSLIFQPNTLPVVSFKNITAYGAYVFADVANKFLTDSDTMPDYENFCALRAKYGNRLDRMLPAHSTAAREAVQSAVRSRLKGKSEFGDLLILNSALFVLPLFGNYIEKGARRYLRTLLAIHIYFRDYANTRYDADESFCKELKDNAVRESCIFYEVISFNAYKKLYDSLPIGMTARMRSIKSKMTNYSNGTVELGELDG